jgi:hypothetical protein
LVVRRIVPLDPTTTPLLASAKETPYRVAEPLNCSVHVVPPFVVRRIVELLPTAVPVFTSVNETA